MRRKNGLSFYNREKRIDKNFIVAVSKFIFWGIAMVLLAFTFVYLFGVRTSVIGASMEPNLYNGQEVMIDRFSYFVTSPKQGDVVVFLPNGNSNFHYYVKRVVAVPGDTIFIRDGIVFVNDKILNNEYSSDMIEDGGIAENGITLGADEYFVLGDNRNNSEDSRSSNVGIVKFEYIIGKAWFHMSSGDAAAGFIK